MFALCTMVTFLRPAAIACSNANSSSRRLPCRVFTPLAMATACGIVADLNVMLVPDVQSLEILAHHHQVDVVEAAARDERARRAQIRVQLEFFAQPDVRGAIAAAGGRLSGTLSARCVRRMLAMVRVGSGSPAGLHTLKARDLAVPLEGRAERIERRQDAVDDFGSDAVSGNESGGNLLCHRGEFLLRPGRRDSIPDQRNSLLIGTKSICSSLPRS